MYLLAVTVFAGLVLVVPVQADFFDSENASEETVDSPNIDPIAERITLFEKDTEPLDEVAIGKWIAKIDYLKATGKL